MDEMLRNDCGTCASDDTKPEGETTEETTTEETAAPAEGEEAEEKAEDNA